MVVGSPQSCQQIPLVYLSSSLCVHTFLSPGKQISLNYKYSFWSRQQILQGFSMWLNHPSVIVQSLRKIPMMKVDHGWHIIFLLLLDQLSWLRLRQRLALRTVPSTALFCCQTHNSIFQGSNPQTLLGAFSVLPDFHSWAKYFSTGLDWS